MFHPKNLRQKQCYTLTGCIFFNMGWGETPPTVVICSFLFLAGDPCMDPGTKGYTTGRQNTCRTPDFLSVLCGEFSHLSKVNKTGRNFNKVWRVMLLVCFSPPMRNHPRNKGLKKGLSSLTPTQIQRMKHENR